MKRDARYNLIKSLVRDGQIKSFLDIFIYVPKTIVATDLGKNYGRFADLLNKIDQFTFEEVFLIGRFCRLNAEEMIKLYMSDYVKGKEQIEKSDTNT